MTDSIWWLFFSLVAGIGFFVSFLLLSKPSKARPGTKPLIFVMLLFSLTLVQFVILWTKTTAIFPHFHDLWKVSNFWYGPLLYFFFIGDKGFQLKKHWPHFILGVLLFFMWIPYGILPSADKIAYLSEKYPPFYSSYLPTNYLLYLSYWWVSAIIQGLYAIYFLASIYVLKRSYGKLQHLIAHLFTVFVLARTIYFLLYNYSFFNPQWDYAISLTMSYCIFRIGIMAFHEPEQFFIPQIIKSQQAKYATTSLTEGQSSRIAELVQQYVEQHKSYLDAQLRLPGLAEQVNVKSHQISQAVNQHFGLSFSDWINGYRIQNACQLLHKGHSAKEAGYQSGFNNIATFYKAFKKEKQLTPAKFRAAQQAESSNSE